MLPSPSFFGPRVVHAAFCMAVVGWGVGFYGPPVFLHAVVQRTGWPLVLVSAAVTVHFLFGAVVVACLPALHRHFGVGSVAVAGAACTSVGVLGWSLATAPWQLFAAALASGAGWVAMGAVAVNAAIAPWYVRGRPMALAKAYNGASVGGLLFSPLWVALIAQMGFTRTALWVGLVMTGAVWWLARHVLRRTPGQLGQHPDGDAAGPATGPAAGPGAVAGARPPALRCLWRDRRFMTLAMGMAAGLFAQIGLLAHLFSMLVPVLGTQPAGLVMGGATACAMGGRLLAARALSPQADRRSVAALAYGVQLAGSVLLAWAWAWAWAWADVGQVAWILLGVAMFGSGIGNATSLPPLIAQAEFAPEDVPRVVARTVAWAQAAYAFAPAACGLLLAATGATAFFLAVAAVQALAILCFLAGRLDRGRLRDAGSR